MIRKFSLLAVVTLFLSFPALAVAGGPPWLCLPLDGVNTANATDCASLLTTKLKGKIWRQSEDPRVKVVQHEDQWYATFPMEESVGLSEVEAALQGSKFSVPRGQLRLFGHVILEIDRKDAAAQDLLSGLKGLSEVSIAETQEKKDRLLVTVDMPYPAFDSARQRGSVGWKSFQRNGLNSDASSREPMSASSLPSYDDFRKLVTAKKGDLKDLRWSDTFACRELGGVTVGKRVAAK